MAPGDSRCTHRGPCNEPGPRARLKSESAGPPPAPAGQARRPLWGGADLGHTEATHLVSQWMDATGIVRHWCSRMAKPSLTNGKQDDC